jgi:hypothetical protein
VCIGAWRTEAKLIISQAYEAEIRQAKNDGRLVRFWPMSMQRHATIVHYRKIGTRASVRDTHLACNSDLTGICNELHNPGGRSSSSVVPDPMADANKAFWHYHR